jgi:hypothetical protein
LKLIDSVKKKCPNNKKEIYDKYKHTRDRLFGLTSTYKEAQHMRNVVDRGCPYDVKIIGHSAVGLNIGNLPLYPNNVYQQPAHKNLTLFSITEFDKHMELVSV